MRSFLTTRLPLLLVIALAASAALAAAHYQVGPSCEDNGNGTVTCTGDIAG